MQEYSSSSSSAFKCFLVVTQIRMLMFLMDWERKNVMTIFYIPPLPPAIPLLCKCISIADNNELINLDSNSSFLSKTALNYYSLLHLKTAHNYSAESLAWAENAIFTRQLLYKWLCPTGSSGGHYGRPSRGAFPAFSAGGHCGQIWHGQGCPSFDVLHPASPLPTTAPCTHPSSCPGGWVS